MKKILLALGTLLVLTTAGFTNHSFAAGKQALQTLIDKDNQEWCTFRFQTPGQDGILDEHKQLAKENGDQWAPCSDYNINRTDPQIQEQYNVSALVGTANLKGRIVCLKDGQEIPCSEKTPSLSLGSGKIVEQTVNKNSLNSSGSSLGECKVNGKPVDCEEMMQDVGGFLKAGLWIMLGFGALSLVGFVFWLVMLIHACSNDIPNKVLWIILLFLFGIIAAIVYYFAVKRHCTTNYIPPANIQPYQASVTVGYQEGPVATTPFVAPVPSAPPTTTPANPITPIITTPVSTVPPTTPPSPTIPTTATTTQTVESMIATSGAGTMSQAPLGSSSSVTPTVPPSDQNNTPLQNPPSTNV